MRRCGSAAIALFAAVFGVFLIEPTAHHDDAAQYWVMAGRLARTGDPFYVAAVDHKGPLWVAMYRLGYAISGDQRWFWFIMAIQVLVFAAIVGWSVKWLLQAMEVGQQAATLTAIVLTAYLVFGPEGYSDLLYGRNITAALTAFAAALGYQAATGYQAAAGRTLHRILMAGLAGVAMGLATQTVFTTLGTTLLLATGIWLVGSGQQRRGWVVTGYLVGAMLGLASAAAWYGLRGVGADFQTYFWDYNLAYGQTDGSWLARGGRALRELGGHHLSRPFLLIAPLGLGLAARFRSDRRFAFVGLWWIGEVASVSAPDRWYVHYWILLAAPSACIGALAFSKLAAVTSSEGAEPRTAHRTGFVIAAVVAALYAVPGIGIGAVAAAGFSGIEQNHDNRLAAQSADFAALRLGVDRHSAPTDPVFIWANAAGPYVTVDRPAASRFDRRTWLTGEVYGTATRATIPGVWDDLIEDLDANEPVLIIEFLDEPINARSPLGMYVAAEYQVIEELALARLYARRATSE